MNERVKLISRYVCVAMLGVVVGASVGVPYGGYLIVQTLRTHGEDIGAVAVEYGLKSAAFSMSGKDGFRYDVYFNGTTDSTVDLQNSIPVATGSSDGNALPEVKLVGKMRKSEIARR